MGIQIKVLLVADPPAGDKVCAKLRDYESLDVTYIRGKKPHFVPSIPAGTQYVLAMNAGPAGSAIKEAARRMGAQFIPIPPAWAAAQVVLEEDGFFRRVQAAEDFRAATEPGEIGLDLSLANRATLRQVAAAVERRSPTLIEAHAPPVAVAREPAPPQGPPKVVEVKRREVIATPPRDAIAARVQQIAAAGQPAVAPSAPGPIVGVHARSARRAAAERLARQMIEANPEVPGTEVMNALRELLGVAIQSPELYRIRREVRAAAGLDPSGCTRSVHRSTLALGRALAKGNGTPAAQIPPLQQQATPHGVVPQVKGVLGTDSQAAIDLLCSTLPRDGVRGLVVTFDANGLPHVEVELAVVRTETVAYTPKVTP